MDSEHFFIFTQDCRQGPLRRKSLPGILAQLEVSTLTPFRSSYLLLFCSIHSRLPNRFSHQSDPLSFLACSHPSEVSQQLAEATQREEQLHKDVAMLRSTIDEAKRDAENNGAALKQLRSAPSSS